MTTLLVNRGTNELRIALVENGVPRELFVEKPTQRGVIGNIYVGKVARVLPGMQAAFIEIGLSRTAFLYVNDALLEEGGDLLGPLSAEVNSADSPQDPTEERSKSNREVPRGDIQTILTAGQEVLVQVQKGPLGTKGARLTRQLSVPGRTLVYLPFSRKVGVSRRIQSELERERLRLALSNAALPEGGYIIRTLAEGLEAATLQAEAVMLHGMWRDIQKRTERGPVPRLVFEDLDVLLRVARDSVGDHVERIVLDDPLDHARLFEFAQTFMKDTAVTLSLHQNATPLFDAFGIEGELQRALDRRVWLKSGGYIVIDQNEALTAIDVNTGRFVGKTDLEATITQLNLEAVREIMHQIRLRNIGGILIIDFIDMALQAHRDQVLTALEDAMTHDRAKMTVVRMSEIGLVEMTRKRTRPSLNEALLEPCPECRGRGTVKSEVTVANEILRALRRQMTHGTRQVLVNMEPQVADVLYGEAEDALAELERVTGTTIIPVARQGFHREQFDLVPV